MSTTRGCGPGPEAGQRWKTRRCGTGGLAVWTPKSPRGPRPAVLRCTVLRMGECARPLRGGPATGEYGRFTRIDYSSSLPVDVHNRMSGTAKASCTSSRPSSTLNEFLGLHSARRPGRAHVAMSGPHRHRRWRVGTAVGRHGEPPRGLGDRRVTRAVRDSEPQDISNQDVTSSRHGLPPWVQPHALAGSLVDAVAAGVLHRRLRGSAERDNLRHRHEQGSSAAGRGRRRGGGPVRVRDRGPP